MHLNIPPPDAAFSPQPSDLTPSAGWVLIFGGPRSSWHWFTEGAEKSICGRADLPPDARHILGDDNSIANCSACAKARQRAAAATPAAQKELGL